MTKKQKARIQKIEDRRNKFAYGLGQADKDIEFLLRVIKLKKAKSRC